MMIRFARLGLLVIVVATLAVSGCNGIGPGRTASSLTYKGSPRFTKRDTSGASRFSPPSVAAGIVHGRNRF